MKPYLAQIKRLRIALDENDQKAILSTAHEIKSLKTALNEFEKRAGTLEQNVATGVQWSKKNIQTAEQFPTEIKVNDRIAKWRTITNGILLFLLGGLSVFFYAKQYKPTIKQKKAYQNAEIVQEEFLPAFIDLSKQMEEQAPNTYNKWLQENEELIKWYDETYVKSSQ